MKKIVSLTAIFCAFAIFTFAQKESKSERINVPAVVKKANMEKYPESKKYHITWEKEKGNYEANWGGKDGEANSVTYTPTGEFIEIVKAISAHELPAPVISYTKEHYKNHKFGDVGKVLDAQGKSSYEVEINGKDVIFDENGQFVKEEK